MGGTVLCVTQESNWPMPFKEAMVASDERDTCLVNRPFRSTSRFYKNNLAKEVLAIEKAKGENLRYEDVQHLTAGERRKEAWRTGDVHHCMLSAGQGIGLIHSVPTVKEVIDGMMQEAEQTINRRLASLTRPAPSTRGTVEASSAGVSTSPTAMAR